MPSCTQCGHASDGLRRCAHCGQLLHRPLARFRRVGWLVGVGVLLLVWSMREAKLVPVDQITPSMNFHTIRVRGTLASNARRQRDGTLYFLLHDGSAKLPVFVFKPDHFTLLLAGDTVSATGKLNVNPELEPSLRIFSASQIAVEYPKEPLPESAVPIGDLLEEQVGKKISVCGRVRKIRVPTEGSRAPWEIYLRDHSGTLPVIYWKKVAAGLSGQTFSEGDRLIVSGRLDRYREQLQLKVFASEDIRQME